MSSTFDQLTSRKVYLTEDAVGDTEAMRKSQVAALLAAISTSSHAAATVLNTNKSVVLALSGQQLSGDVRLQTTLGGSQGQIVAAVDGSLYVVLGTGANAAAAGNHTHSAATTLAAGFLSASDKTKLDGIAAGATANAGTVTSVGLTLPVGFTIGSSPVTGAGTIAVTMTLSGLLKCDGASTITAAVAGTDYLAPAAIGVTVQGYRLELTKTGVKWTDIASASSIDLGAANGDYGDITGTTAITSFGTVAAGTERETRFAGILTLTHNGSTLILLTGANITTAAGDVARWRSTGGGWRMTDYVRASGLPLVGGGGGIGSVNGIVKGDGAGNASQAVAGTDFQGADATLATLAGKTISGTGNVVLQSYVDGVIAGIKSKASVLVASTANLTLSGEQTIDGVLTSGSRVLVKDQTAPAENGIYVSGAGAWTRATDFDAWTEIPAALVAVERGTASADFIFISSADQGGTLGSTAITFTNWLALALKIANALSELTSVAATARTNLGLTIGTNVQAYNANLTTFAGIAPSANVQSMLGAADYAAIRTLLGLLIGTNVQAYDADLTTWAGLTPSANAQSFVTAADYAAMRVLLGLVIGTNVQAYDAELAALAGLTSAADKLPYFSGSGTAALADLSSFGRSLIDDAAAVNARSTLGLAIGTDVQAYNANLTTFAGIAPSANVQSVLGAADYAAIRTLLALVIGTNVQAYNANLTTFAGIAPSSNVQSVLGAADYAAIKTLLGLVIGTNVQAYDADLTTWAGLTPSANAQSFVTAADYAAMRALLGLVIGTNVQAYDADLTTWAGLTPSANAQSFVTAADYAAMRVLLGLVIGTNVQAYDADLDALAAAGTGSELAKLGVHGADIASASTVNLETATGETVDVTGTVTITAITLNEGHRRIVRFTGALTLTNGASLVLPGGANITTVAGDYAVFMGYASSVVRCVFYEKVTITGSGSEVRANSPTFVSPVLGAATATSLNVNGLQLQASNIASGAGLGSPSGLATDIGLYWSSYYYLLINATAILLAKPTCPAANDFCALGSISPLLRWSNVISILGNFSGAITAAGGIVGTATNDNATSGNVGQVTSSAVASGSAVSLSTATAKDVTSISLTAGDWDVDGAINFAAAAATVTAMLGGIVSSTNTVPSDGTEVYSGVVMTLASGTDGVTIPRKRISIASTTTIYLDAKATFSAGAVTAYGSLYARRIR